MRTSLIEVGWLQVFINCLILGSPVGAPKEVLAEQVKVINRKHPAIRELERFGIATVPVDEVVPDLDLGLEIPGLPVVAAEARPDASRSVVERRAHAIRSH